MQLPQDIFPILESVISRYEASAPAAVHGKDAGKALNTQALIPALQSAQNLLGWLPEEVLMWLSERLALPFSEVAGVVSFYSFFSIHPRGKHVVRACMGTACYVRGGKEVLEALQNELQIKVGETTEDFQFSLEVGRCFGACGLAPVVMVDDDVHQRVRPARLPEILQKYREDAANE